MSEVNGRVRNLRTVEVPIVELVELHRSIEELQRIALSMLERVSIRGLEEIVQEQRARRSHLKSEGLRLCTFCRKV